jgi:hypothetical protein
MLGTFETDDKFNTLKQKHITNPIDMHESSNMLFDFIMHAAEKIRNPELFAKIMGPYVHSQADPAKALYLLLSDVERLDHLVATSESQDEAADAYDQLNRIGHYNPIKDSVYVEPLTNLERSDMYDKDDWGVKKLYKQMLGTLRHELSHRQQYYEGHDKLVHKYGTTDLGSANINAATIVNEHNKYDPNELLKDGLDNDEWEQRPIEWTAVADEAGYMLRKVFNYANLPNNNDELEDELYKLGGNFPRIINVFQGLMNANEPNVVAAAKQARDVWLNRVRESYELGNVKISDERLKNKLVKAGEGYKGTSNIREQLLAEAAANGVTGETAEALINQVLEKINNTETNQVGKTLGQAQDPNARYRRMASIISQLRSY